MDPRNPPYRCDLCGSPAEFEIIDANDDTKPIVLFSCTMCYYQVLPDGFFASKRVNK